MKDLDLYGMIALILLIVGGINWLIAGLLGQDLIGSIFPALLARLIYIIVGLAALYFCYLLYLDKTKKVI